jgi:N-acyl-D-amino-acid deacylase
MKEKPLAVNLATLIAHGSVRSRVMGLADRAPTPDELQKMEGLVDQGMKDGAVGLSTVQGIMAEPFNMIASDSGVRQADESVPHPRGYGNKFRVLGHYVRELKLISLEDAVQKMTSLPAQAFGFRDRGMVREGFAADLVIFDENTVADRATLDKPHQFPTGINYVIVNGELVIADGQLTSARPGMALRGPGYVRAA